MSRFWLLTSGIVLTAAATGVTVAVAATGVAHDPTGVALARALTVALPCAAGLCAWLTGESARLGRLLLLTAALLFASTFAESADPATYTLGRAAGWVVEVLLVALVLAYPSGRLTGRADRLIVAAAGLTVAVGFVPGLFLSEHLPVPSPFTSCTADCPPSALFALDRPIGAVDATLRILGPTLLAVVTTAVTIRLWARAQNATPLARRMYLPVLAIAITWAALMGAAVVARAIAPSWIGLEVIAWCLALAVPAAATAFLVGLVRWRLFTAHAILRLTRCLPAADAASLERAFALAFDDPQLRLVYPAVDGEADGWCDAAGFDVTAPLPGGPRTLTPGPPSPGPR